MSMPSPTSSTSPAQAFRPARQSARVRHQVLPYPGGHGGVPPLDCRTAQEVFLPT